MEMHSSPLEKSKGYNNWIRSHEAEQEKKLDIMHVRTLLVRPT